MYTYSHNCSNFLSEYGEVMELHYLFKIEAKVLIYTFQGAKLTSHNVLSVDDWHVGWQVETLKSHDYFFLQSSFSTKKLLLWIPEQVYFVWYEFNFVTLDLKSSVFCVIKIANPSDMVGI